MGKCEVCGKINNSARKYSYRGTQVTKRFLRMQKPNVKSLKIIQNGVVKRLGVCTRCMKGNKVTRAI